MNPSGIALGLVVGALSGTLILFAVIIAVKQSKLKDPNYKPIVGLVLPVPFLMTGGYFADAFGGSARFQAMFDSYIQASAGIFLAMMLIPGYWLIVRCARVLRESARS